MDPGHCEACPLRGSATPCPDPAHYCRRIAHDLTLPEVARFWGGKLLEDAGRPARADLAPAPDPAPTLAAPPAPDPSAPGPRPPMRPSPRRPGRVSVGILTVSYGLGGAEQWVSHLLELLDRGRVHVAGVAAKHEVPLPNLRAHWESMVPVGVGHDDIRALASSVDVLITWGVLDLDWGISPELLDWLVPAHVPVVNVSHDSREFPGVAQLSRSIPAAVCRPALRWLPPSKRADAKVILNQVSPDRVATSESPEETRRGWGVAPGVKVAGWLGRFSPEKGPLAFIDGVAALPPDWVGVMVGSGWKEDEVRAHAEGSAPGRIVFAGPVEHPGNALAAFDCLVMPSVSEACSISALEANLAGTPLVWTRTGMAEDHPWLGRLIEANPPTGEQVARAILDDDADRPARDARVAAAREFARVEAGPGRFRREWTDFICRLGPRHLRKAAVSEKVARDIDLMKRRRDCPHAKKAPGCGCNDAVICGRADGQQRSRAQCYECIQAT
jgi:glycosyltransferase involved in cell wall biosynthesis